MGYYKAGVASGGLSSSRCHWGQVQVYVSLFRLGCDFCVRFKGLSWQCTASSGAFILASLNGIEEEKEQIPRSYSFATEMKNRTTGFCRLRRGNLGLISAQSLQAAEAGSGLQLSIWQDQTKATSNNSEKVLLMYAKSEKDVACLRDRRDALFSSHRSPKLFSCYRFLQLILRSHMP